CAVLAEALFGAGKGLSPVFYITIGSGIGGGLIINGEIHRGVGQGAAELGHLRVPVLSENGLRYAPLENVASGWGIEAAARSRATDTKAAKAVLDLANGQVDQIKTEQVARAAEIGDAFALALLRQAWEALAEAICHVIALVCPQRIVIGCGVSLIGAKLLFAPLPCFVA